MASQKATPATTPATPATSATPAKQKRPRSPTAQDLGDARALLRVFETNERAAKALCHPRAQKHIAKFYTVIRAAAKAASVAELDRAQKELTAKQEEVAQLNDLLK